MADNSIVSALGGAMGQLQRLSAAVRLTDDHTARICGDADFAADAKKWLACEGMPNLPSSETPVFKALGKKGYFGTRSWSKYLWYRLPESLFYKVPPFPLETLERQCSLSLHGQKIRQTHRLILSLGELLSSPFWYSDLLRMAKRSGKLKFDALDFSSTSEGTAYWDKVLGPRAFQWLLIPTYNPPSQGFENSSDYFKAHPEYEPMSLGEVSFTHFCREMMGDTVRDSLLTATEAGIEKGSEDWATKWGYSNAYWEIVHRPMMWYIRRRYCHPNGSWEKDFHGTYAMKYRL